MRKHTAERELLDQRQREFFAAMADGDADRIAELFADAAVGHVANRPPSTWLGPWEEAELLAYGSGITNHVERAGASALTTME